MGISAFWDGRRELERCTAVCSMAPEDIFNIIWGATCLRYVGITVLQKDTHTNHAIIVQQKRLNWTKMGVDYMSWIFINQIHIVINYKLWWNIFTKILHIVLSRVIALGVVSNVKNRKYNYTIYLLHQMYYNNISHMFIILKLIVAGYYS